MRKPDKIEKYAAKLVEQYHGEVIEADKSRYFKVNGRILRISDHIGSNSSGNISIIIPDFSDKGEYIVHAHASGSITIASYEQVKDIVRSFIFMSSFVYEVVQPNFTFEVEKRDRFNSSTECQKYQEEIERLKKIEKKYEKLKEFSSFSSDTESIMGVPSEMFTEGQLKGIKLMVDSVMRNLKK